VNKQLAACWAVLGLIAGSSSGVMADAAAKTEPDPIGVRIRCDTDRAGSGVVVRDFRPDHRDGLLLLTALHVVQGCSRIAADAVGCRAADQQPLAAWDAERPIELVLWNSYDLAAIVIPDADRAAVQARVPVFELPSRSQGVLPHYASMTLMARGSLNPCPRVPAMLRDIIEVGELYTVGDEADYFRVFGSLAPDTTVMSYQATATPGMSGGPVVWQRSNGEAVVAVHLGGHALVLSWGVVLNSSELLRVWQSAPDQHVAHLDATHRSVQAHEFGAPNELVQPKPESSADLDIALHRDSLSFQYEASTPVDPFGALSNSLQFGWSHQWLRSPVALDSSLGTRVVVAGTGGLYRSPVFDPKDPSRQENPLAGTAKLPFVGGFAEADVEAHFARFAPLGWGLGLGMRLGVSHVPDVEPAQTHVVWGPVLYGRLRWSFSDRLAGIGQLHLTVQRIPADKTPIDCTGPSLPAPEQWDVWGGLSLGMELGL
jgi:hypothetical protein